LLAAFKEEVTYSSIKDGGVPMNFEVSDPILLAGVLVGAMLPFLFGALTMISVGKAAAEMIEEVRRQFREVKNAHGITLLDAIKKVRGEMGLTNVEIMIPFVRTVDMAKDVNEVLEKNGLKRGENGLKVNMMAELPSNVFLADEFLEYFDGFSIGSNDLTQLTLGLDRDSGLVAQYFDERNPAVMKGLETLIKAAKAKGKYVGICGQGPSDHPDLAKWLMEQGIDSVSLNPDSVIPTWQFLGKSS